MNKEEKKTLHELMIWCFISGLSVMYTIMKFIHD